MNVLEKDAGTVSLMTQLVLPHTYTGADFELCLIFYPARQSLEAVIPFTPTIQSQSSLGLCCLSSLLELWVVQHVHDDVDASTNNEIPAGSNTVSTSTNN